MITRSGTWLIGLGGSVVVHALLVVLTVNAFKADPIQQQDSPESALDVQAYELDRVAAAEQQPVQDSPSELAPETSRATTAGIARSQATALALPGSPPLTSRAVPIGAAQALTPKTAIQTPVSAEPTALPTAQQMVVAAEAVPASANPVDLSSLAPSSLRQSKPQVESARPQPATVPKAEATAAESELASQPTLISSPVDLERIAPPSAPQEVILSAQLGSSSPEPMAMEPGRAELIGIASTSPRPVVTRPTSANPEQITAALAFDGSGTGDIDPVSVAAFQSFMRPGDAVATTDPLRDGVSALLAQVPCARLQVAFDPQTTTLQVRGHIPDDMLRAPVLSALKTQIGEDIEVSDSIRILPRPQCGALSGIAAVGLPQSTDQITNPLLIGEDTQARVLDFVRDDRLFFDLTAPDYDALIYVDYFDAEGNVLHLAPNELVPQRLTPAKSQFRVGARDENETGLQIFIGPPYGQEIAVAFAASEPLYSEPRPLVEPAAPYLNWLKDRVSQARSNDPDFKGEWVYFFITTAEGEGSTQ